MALAAACAEAWAGATREIHIESGGVDDDGARALAEALEQNGSLTTVKLEVSG